MRLCLALQTTSSPMLLRAGSDVERPWEVLAIQDTSMPLRASTHGYAYTSSLSPHPETNMTSCQAHGQAVLIPCSPRRFSRLRQDGKSLCSQALRLWCGLAQQLKSSRVRYTACTA